MLPTSCGYAWPQEVGDIRGSEVYSGFGFVSSLNGSVPGAIGTIGRSAGAMTTPRAREQTDPLSPPDRLLPRQSDGSSPHDICRIRLAPLFVATLRVPRDIARRTRNLGADFGTLPQLQDGLQRLTDEVMLDRYFGAVGNESDGPSANKVRPCRTKF